MAARDGVHGPAGDYPERRYVPEYGGMPSPPIALAAAGAAVAIGAGAYALLKRRR
jgi:hypothetical protein